MQQPESSVQFSSSTYPQRNGVRSEEEQHIALAVVGKLANFSFN